MSRLSSLLSSHDSLFLPSPALLNCFIRTSFLIVGRALAFTYILSTSIRIHQYQISSPPSSRAFSIPHLYSNTKKASTSITHQRLNYVHLPLGVFTSNRRSFHNEISSLTYIIDIRPRKLFSSLFFFNYQDQQSIGQRLG